MEPKIENAGQKLQYRQDIKIKGSKINKEYDWMEGDNIVGQKVTWEVVTSALGNRGGTCESWLRYGKGFSIEKDLMKMSVELGVVEKSGYWYTLPNNEKVQGDDAFYYLLKDNSIIRNEISSRIKELTK